MTGTGSAIGPDGATPRAGANLVRLGSRWGWLHLAGDRPLGLPVPPGAIGAAWAERLRGWDARGRPAPDSPERAILARTLDTLVRERYLGPGRPRVARAAVSSRDVPRALRWALHRLAAPPSATAGALPPDAGPAWPDDTTADELRRILDPAPGTRPAEAAFGLSFDLDTPASHAAAMALAGRLADLGHRATFFVVGADIARAGRLIAHLRDRGHEIGLHGWVHDFRLPYLGPVAARRALTRLAAAARAAGAVGYRGPALLSTPALRRALARIFAYDSSLPATDRDSLLGPRRGCGATVPFELDGLIQVPVSAPLEDRLLLAGWTWDAVLEQWGTLVARTVARGGWRVIGCHLEPHLGGSPARRAALERWLATPGLPRSRTIADLAQLDCARPGKRGRE